MICDTVSQGLRKRVGPARQASSFTETDAFKSKTDCISRNNHSKASAPLPPQLSKPGLFALVCDQIHDRHTALMVTLKPKKQTNKKH